MLVEQLQRQTAMQRLDSLFLAQTLPGAPLMTRWHIFPIFAFLWTQSAQDIFSTGVIPLIEGSFGRTVKVSSDFDRG